MGAQSGSTAYQSSLGTAYSSGLTAGTNLANTAANQYGTAASESASKYGTAASENVGLTTTENAYNLGEDTLAEEKNKNTSSGIGSLFSGIASIIGLQKGSDSTPGGPAVVGEHGPELVQMPQGAKVYPNIKDGYDMLNYITRTVKEGTDKQSAQVNPPPQMDPTNQEVSNTAMIAALHDKLNKVASAIKKGK
jgi:hypothetical protein